MGRPSIPLSANLPPLILGTATFNSQYNPDPYALPTTALVQRALSAGIRAFDTSPYYGPAEELLGRALSTSFVRSNFPRPSYHLLTKVGRLAASSFDYSPAWVRHSVHCSLQKLDTPYLDVVYCHDVEFVTPEEVLKAVRELRRIRDVDGSVHYVGISGYPMQVVCSLAEMILRETGEPLDIVMSYANFTLQNTRLLTEGLPRLLVAGVDVVLNASPLGMGLLRRQGVPIGKMGDFHPAPDGLRTAINSAGVWVDQQGEKLEAVAIRFALGLWLREGARVGVLGPLLSPSVNKPLGASVIGVSHMEELEETLRVWRSIIDGLGNQSDDGNAIEDNPAVYDEKSPSNLASLQPPAVLNPSDITDEKLSEKARLPDHILVKGIRSILGSEWRDYEWPSPGPDFVNSLPEGHKDALEKEEER